MEIKQEVSLKIAKIRTLIEKLDLEAVLLKKQANFSWLTAGGLNLVGIATEVGVASLLITKEHKFLIANNIEGPRIMIEEGLQEFGFQLLSFEWYENKEWDLVNDVIDPNSVGCDIPWSACKNVEENMQILRSQLSENELERYRFLGLKLSTAVENTLQEIKPGMSEAEICGRLSVELWPNRIDPVGFVVAADERTKLYRHPIPTLNKVKDYLIFSTNARYKGLVASLTRAIYFGKLPQSLEKQYRANLHIEGIMIYETRVGNEVINPFKKGLKAYENQGYKDEWLLHHQGGLTGYASRENKVTANSKEQILLNQAYCWNPSITGTKCEDTFLVKENEAEMMTKPITFPIIKIEVNGEELIRPAILQL